MIKNEKWEYIIDYNFDYAISDFGRIRSFKKSKCMFLSQMNDKDGYKIVGLSKNGKIITHKVHRLVALMFIENPHNYNIVDHINRINNDNRVENLRWVSPSKNCRNSISSYDASSKYNGVFWYDAIKKYRETVAIGKKREYLGSFDCEIYAAIMFDKYCIENSLDRELNFIR